MSRTVSLSKETVDETEDFLVKHRDKLKTVGLKIRSARSELVLLPR